MSAPAQPPFGGWPQSAPMGNQPAWGGAPQWGQWQAPPPKPKGSRTLVGVLIGLIAAVVVAVAIGGVLLLQRSQTQVQGTPPQTSTLPPPSSQPPSSEPPSSEPPSSEPPTPTTLPPTATPTGPTPSATPQTTGPITPTPTRTTARPTPTPTKTTAKPKPTKPVSNEDYLQRNPLYSFSMVGSDCTQPARPLGSTPKEDQKYLKNMVNCMVTAWAPELKEAGFKVTTPDVIIYTGEIDTPCGRGLAGYPVFYCGANETIYSSAGATAEYGQTLRLAGYWLVMHEFGHHIQQRIGVLEAGYTRDEEQMQISRRIELQADCFMGITSHTVRSTKMTEADRQEMRDWRQAAADKIHGQTASQLFWVFRGFGTSDLGQCNTWVKSAGHLS